MAARSSSTSSSSRGLTVDYDSAHVPTVRRFFDSDVRIRGLMGPFGSGKSSGCVMEMIRRAAAQAPGPDGVRRSRWAVIRNTYRQLEDTTLRTVHSWFPPYAFGQWRQADMSYTMRWGDTECELLFRALDRADQVGNLLSLELTGAWLNEAREIPWSIVQAVLGRIGRYPSAREGGCTWYGLIADSNPPDDDHWWYKLFEEDKPVDVALFRQPGGLSEHAENLPNLPNGRAYYELLARTYDPASRRVYVDGEYGLVLDGKPVYADYRDDVHCSEKALYVPGRTIYRGWDFGLTPACVLTQLLPSGRWLVIDELVADNVGVDRFSDRVLRHMGEEYPGAKCEDVGDPAGAQRAQTDERTCFEILSAKGISIGPGAQDIVARLESVRKPMNTLVDGGPGMIMHPKCRTLRKGFAGRYQYRRMQTSAERYADVPEKNQYSHVHDALQYVATRLFGSALRESVEEKRPLDRYARRDRVRQSAWAI